MGATTSRLVVALVALATATAVVPMGSVGQASDGDGDGPSPPLAGFPGPGTGMFEEALEQAEDQPTFPTAEDACPDVEGAAPCKAARALPFVQDAKLAAEDGEREDLFGWAVDVDGDTAVVGALWDDKKAGSAYVFIRDADGAWTLDAKLGPVDGEPGDRAGVSVAVDGDTVVIGANQDDVEGQARQGSAYVFTRDRAATWSQADKLVAADGDGRDNFGSAVALDGDRVLVGANGDHVDGVWRQGSVYVFERVAEGGWSQEAKLTASDGTDGDPFGLALALEGDTAVVGTPFDNLNRDPGEKGEGRVYVFTRTADGWVEDAKLTASDREELDLFGYSVDLEGDRILVGAPLDDVDGRENLGSGYLFVRGADGGWTEVTKLTDPDREPSRYLGAGADLEDGQALLGAPGTEVNGAPFHGQAYVFTETPLGWLVTSQLGPADGQELDFFGFSVGLDEGTAIAGAHLDTVDETYRQGSAYVFNSLVPSTPGLIP